MSNSIIGDDEGWLWLGLRNGRLVRFNPSMASQQPGSRQGEQIHFSDQTRTFDWRDGLPVGEFPPGNSAVRSSNGTLYWGNDAGLVSLRLEDLPPPSASPIVHLDELRLFDEPPIWSQGVGIRSAGGDDL